MKRWRRRVLVGFTCSALSLSGCGRELPSTPTLRIGILHPAVSGSVGVAAENLRGVALALDEVGSRGLVIADRRHRIEVVELPVDTPEEAVSGFRELLARHDVSAVIGPYTSVSALPVAALAEQARIPLISPGSTMSELTAGRRFVFRMTCSNQYQAEIMADFAQRELTATKAAVLFDIAEPYGRSLAHAFRRRFESSGNQVTAFQTYTTGDSDFPEQLAVIGESGAEVLFLPGYSRAVSLQVRQAQQRGLEVEFLSADAFDVSDLSEAGHLDGVYQVHHWHPEVGGEASRRFVRAYMERYESVPVSGAALSYDAMRLLFDALEEADGVDPQSIRDSIANQSDWPGVTGAIGFAGSGEPRKGGVVLQIENGQSVLQQEIDPPS